VLDRLVDSHFRDTKRRGCLDRGAVNFSFYFMLACCGPIQSDQITMKTEASRVKPFLVPVSVFSSKSLHSLVGIILAIRLVKYIKVNHGAEK
jgi:hypothetical protein